MEEVRDFLKDITDKLHQSQQQTDDQPCSSKSSGSDKHSKKRKPTVLPTSFLKKRKQPARAIQTWDKEIVLFPKDYSCSKRKEIPIPRGKLNFWLYLITLNLFITNFIIL